MLRNHGEHDVSGSYEAYILYDLHWPHLDVRPARRQSASHTVYFHLDNVQGEVCPQLTCDVWHVETDEHLLDVLVKLHEQGSGQRSRLNSPSCLPRIQSNGIR